MTLLSDLDYELPPELIAQAPLPERDRSRLLHLAPDGSLRHRAFSDLPRLLSPGDLLVLNDSRVFPARLVGTRGRAGGSCELLLLEDLGENRWRVLARPARKIREGMRIHFGNARLQAQVEAVEPDGRRVVRFDFDGSWDALLDELGSTPIPPYIESEHEESLLRERYQTVYARPAGSIAAPTAGLHFTEAMFRALDEGGVGRAFLTHHVGYATFEPIRADVLEDHRMGSERTFVPQETIDRIRAARESGRLVVAVGTTTVRALESLARAGYASPQGGWRTTDLFITPGFEFRVVGGLLTNFHLPRSSLLALVSAFGGREKVLHAYREAVRERYRFYSFGDAMLLSPLVR